MSMPNQGSLIGPDLSDFVGIDTVSGQEKQYCPFQGTLIQDGPTDGEYSFTYCYSLEDIATAVSMEVSASVSYMGVGSASAAFESAKAQHTTESDLTIVVRNFNPVGTWRLGRDLILSSDAMTAMNGDAAEFLRLYGDSFVSSITMGTAYFGFLTLKCKDLVTREATAYSLNASLKAGAVSASASFSETFYQSVAKTSQEVRFIDVSTGVPFPAHASQSTVLEFGRTFSTNREIQPVAIARRITEYEKLALRDDPFKPISKALTNRKHLQALVGDRRTVQTIQEAIEGIQRVYAFYATPASGCFVDKALDEWQAKAQKDLDTVAQTVTQYTSNPLGDLEVPALASIVKQGQATLGPVLNIHSETSDWLKGDENGMAAHDPVLDPATFMMKRTRISYLEKSDAIYTEVLRVTYDSEIPGLVAGDPFQKSQVISYTNAGEHPTDKTTFSPGEWINSAWCCQYGWPVRLTFTTTNGRTIAWNGDENVGSDHKVTINVPDDAVLLGFQGSGDHSLQSLRFVWAKFLPSTTQALPST